MGVRVLVVAACLLLGFGIGRLARDDPGARTTTGRDATAADPDRARTRAVQLPRVRGRVMFPPIWTPASVEVRLGEAGTRASRATTAARDDGYRFEFQDVQPGSYRLTASIDRRRPGAEASIEVEDRAVEQDLAFELPPLEGSAILRALGPDGEDAGEVQCTLSLRGPDGSTGIAGGTRSLGGGLYLVLVPGRLPERFDSCTLRLASARYGELTIPFDPRDDEPPVVRFAEPARLTIAVLGLVSSPHAPYLHVRMRPAGSEERPHDRRDATIDAQGNVEVRAVQPGALEVFLCVDAEPGACAIAVKPVAVQPGANRAEIGIPTLHALRVVRTRDDVEAIGARFLAEPPLDSSRNARFRGDEATLERLLPGTYELTGHSDGASWTKRVRVPEETTVEVP